MKTEKELYQAINYIKTQQDDVADFLVKYNNKKVRIMIYGKMALNEPTEVSSFEYENKVKLVNLYEKEEKIDELEEKNKVEGVN